jgi:phage/plasmid-like protein (TIGR03299 family)
MAHGIQEFDSMFSVRESPWHGLGVVLDKRPKNVDAAIKAAGLDWEVEQLPVMVKIGGEGDDSIYGEVPGHYVNVRSDTGHALGIVSKRYTPVQNKQAFSFLSGIFESEMHFETAGSLMNGRRVWVLMRLPEWVEVGGDEVMPYAFISNSHDGKSSVLSACTPVRVVCANTLNAAVRRAKGMSADRTYTIRHLGNMDNKLAEARNVMQVTVNYYEQFKVLGDSLAQHKVTNHTRKRFLETLLPVTDDLGDRAAKNRIDAREEIEKIFRGESEHPETQGNAPGTMWCLYNSAAEYADWFRKERKDGGRFQRAIDDPDSFKQNAWDLALKAGGLA